MRFAQDTLYVTDLDGTLLGPDARVPDEAVEMLNEMLDAGLPFTVATARSWASAGPIIKTLRLKLPIVVHNGAFIVQPQTGAAVDRCLLDRQQMEQIAGIFLDKGISPMVYAHIDGQEKVSWLRELEHDGTRRYVRDRAGDPRLNPVESVESLYRGDLFYLSMLASRQMLEPLEAEVRALDFVSVSFTNDAYHHDLYWLEISRRDATKAMGVQKLRQLTGIERIVCFGDNLNDLPMFEVAQECYAVGNAKEELKRIATGVIGANTEMGVPRFLLERG